MLVGDAAPDHKATLLASLGSKAFLTPQSLPAPDACATPAAGIATGQSTAGAGMIAAKNYLWRLIPPDSVHPSPQAAKDLQLCDSAGVRIVTDYCRQFA